MAADTEHEEVALALVDVDAPDILRLDSKQIMVAEVRTPLFYIDDKPYTVQTNPSPTVGLRYLHILRHRGPDQAQAYLLEALLGVAGFRALINFKALTDEQFETVLARAVKIATKNRAAPDPKRSRQNGSRRQLSSSGL